MSNNEQIHIGANPPTFSSEDIDFILSDSFNETNKPQDTPLNVTVIGDSLYTSGYVGVLEDLLQTAGHNVSFNDQSRLGATSAYAKEAVDTIINSENKPDIVVIALGGNDILNGNDPETVRANLDYAMSALEKEGIEMVIGGIKAPAWFDNEYREDFDKIYGELSEKHCAELEPLMLKSVIKDENAQSLSGLFNQEYMSDQIHPNAEGGILIGQDLFNELEAAIEKLDIEAAPLQEPATPSEPPRH